MQLYRTYAPFVRRNEEEEQIVYFRQITDCGSPVQSIQKTKALLQEIIKENDSVIELSGSPVEEEPQYQEWEKIGLKPKGDFAYMVEFFSFDLIEYDADEYIGAYGGVNSEYIKESMHLIQQVEYRAKVLQDKYADKGIKVTVNGMNDGCQFGMAVYVWIPYQ